MTVAAVVLAAGAGRRFNRDDPEARPGAKLLVDLAGRPVVRWAIDAASAAGADEVIVVSGAADLSTVVPGGVTVLDNPDWSTGQASSLAVALRWCEQRGHARAVIGLGDMPGLTGEAWRRVAGCEGGPLVFATYDGRRGHPVALDAEVWALLATSGDEGARSLAREHPEWVCEVACNGAPNDIDVPEDLERWN